MDQEPSIYANPSIFFVPDCLLLMFKLNQDSLGDVILLTSQVVSYRSSRRIKIYRGRSVFIWMFLHHTQSPLSEIGDKHASLPIALSLFMTHAQVVRLAQNHEHTLNFQWWWFLSLLSGIYTLPAMHSLLVTLYIEIRENGKISSRAVFKCFFVCFLPSFPFFPKIWFF